MEVNYRIGVGSKIALLTVAVLFDLLGLILIFFAIGLLVNTILGILYALYSGFIFMLIGVPILSFRRMKAWGVSMVGELFPIVNALPALTFGTVLVIIATNREDRERSQIS